MQSCYLEKLHASMDVYIACRYVSYEYVYPDSRYLSVCMPVYTYKKGQQMTSHSAEPQEPRQPRHCSFVLVHLRGVEYTTGVNRTATCRQSIRH